MSADYYPPPNAGRAVVDAWYADHAPCECSHFRMLHAPRCRVEGCRCQAFEEPRPHEAPPMANGPNIVCSACGLIRIDFRNGPFCKTCSAQIEGVL